MSADAFDFAFQPNAQESGTWVPHPVFGPIYDNAELTEWVRAQLTAAGKTFTTADLELIGDKFGEGIVHFSRWPRRGRRIFNRFNFNPTCGKVFPSTDSTVTAENADVDINVSTSTACRTELRAGLGMHLKEIRGERKPNIETVLTFPGGLSFQYTPSGAFHIIGSDFGDIPNITPTNEYGVHAVPVGGGAAVKAMVITNWTDGEIRGVWAASLTGSYFVRVTANYGGSPRSGSSGSPMTG